MKNLSFRKNCLIVSSPYSWGGGIKVMIDETIKALKICGYDINLLMPLLPGTKKFLPKTLYINTLRFVNFDRFPLLHHVFFGLKARNLVKSYDSLHAVVATSHTALPLALSGKQFSLWVATTYADELESKYRSELGDLPAMKLRHSFQWIFLEQIEKYVFRKAKKIFTLSDYTAQKILEINPNLKNKVDVLNIPIDTKLFRSIRSAKKENNLIFTGRWKDPRKNIYFLFSALSLLKKVMPSIRLILVGEKIDDRTKNILKKLEIAKSVKFIPSVDRNKVPNYLNKSELFVCTSVQEGLGISILEAMACGLPVVVNNCGGPESIVKKSGGGFVVESNPQVLANILSRLLKDKNKVRKLGNKARVYVKRNFSYKKFMDKLIREFDGPERRLS